MEGFRHFGDKPKERESIGIKELIGENLYPSLSPIDDSSRGNPFMTETSKSLTFKCRGNVGHNPCYVLDPIRTVFLNCTHQVTRMDFKIKLAEIRTAKGLTQEELALKCNVTARTIQRIESGKVKPRSHTIKAISNALEFDFLEPAKSQSRYSISWWIKDLFNLKTKKMRKISILTSSILVTGVATFILVSKIQAQSIPKEVPKSGISITYNSDKSVRRIDAVFTNKLTLDSLIDISETLKNMNISLKYRSMEFDDKGQLTGISCEITEDGDLGSGGFSVGHLDSLNGGNAFGFYYDYSADTESAFCSGSCW